MFRPVRSYVTALRASRKFGRASRLRGKGQTDKALAIAREALNLLSQSHVIRSNPAEVAVLTSATVLVEGVAAELNKPGASVEDLSDTLKCVRDQPDGAGLKEWIPYLESRLKEEQGNDTAV